MTSWHKAMAAMVLALASAMLGCGGAHVVNPRVVQDGTSILIVDDANDAITIDIRFEIDSHALRPASHTPLDALVAYLVAREDYTLIEVQGHSDERGSAAYNMRLSRQRAESVIHYLVESGVQRERLRATGFGATRPAVQGTDESAWSRNRRVEFLIVEQVEST